VIAVGERVEIQHTFSADDVAAFAKLSGDYHPLHIDDSYAETTRFGRRVVHGMLVASLLSQIVGMKLPDTILVSQSLKFQKPVYIGDCLTVTGIVSRSYSTGLAELALFIKRGSDTVASGKVVVKAFA
jgi:acyl dehydratase